MATKKTAAKKKAAPKKKDKLATTEPKGMASMSEEQAAMYAADVEENMLNVVDSFYTISIQGSRFKVEGKIIGDNGISFDAIIVRNIPVNVFYKKAYDKDDPTPPDCTSLGGHKPDAGVEHKESESCASCPQNRFGTGTDANGEPGKGKACRNTMRLVLLVEGIKLPVVLHLPPTSIKGFRNLAKDLTARSVPLAAAKTTFSFDTNVEYPRPLMEAGELMNPEVYFKTIRPYRTSIEVENAVKAYASIEDLANSEGARDSTPDVPDLEEEF